jgi:hypothetical protein
MDDVVGQTQALQQEILGLITDQTAQTSNQVHSNAYSIIFLLLCIYKK